MVKSPFNLPHSVCLFVAVDLKLRCLLRLWEAESKPPTGGAGPDEGPEQELGTADRRSHAGREVSRINGEAVLMTDCRPVNVKAL